MLVSTALTRIKRQFGDEYGVVITDTDIYGWIYSAELDIIRNTGCNDNNIDVSSASYPFVAPAAVNIKRISINGKALKLTSVAEIDLLGLSTEIDGYPQYWYKKTNEIFIWPHSDTVVTTNIHYNKTPSIMTGLPADNDFTVPDVFQDDVIKYCIGRAHNKNNNLQAEGVQMALYDQALNTRRDESQSADTVLYKSADPFDYEEYDGSYN